LSALLLPGLSVAGCFNDNGYDLDQASGATAPHGGNTNGAGGKGNVSGSKSMSDAGDSLGGAADVDPNYPAPKIDSMEPASGPYGTEVTIRGEGLGNGALAGFSLVLGNQGEVVLNPKDKQSVVSWSDEEIVFRYPFPAEGAVSLEAPKGALVAGDFAPTWHVARAIEQAPAASVLATVSPAPDHLVMLFDTMPLTVLDVGPEDVVEHAMAGPAVDPTSLRLYLNATQLVEAVGVTTDADPALVHYTNQGGDLAGAATSIKLAATEYRVAGGSAGAAVWMNRATGWARARPSAATWKVDKGPIADPSPNAPDRASGATSDGSLYLAHSEDASFLTDDMEAPYMARLAPTATQFASSSKAGYAVDDYVSSLVLTSSGNGLVVRVCGSDVDPFGFSGTDHYCYDGLHAPGGAQLLGVPVDAKASAHAFTQDRVIAAYCSGNDRRWFIRTDLDVETAPGEPLGEQVLFPCPEAVALDVNGDGDFVPVVRWASQTYLLERNPAAK
jgi:hypothetical protein